MAEILIFLRRQKVQQLTRLARSTICKRVQDDTFPKPVRIGPRAVARVESDIAD